MAAASSSAAASEQHLVLALRRFLRLAARLTSCATLVYLDQEYSKEAVKEVGGDTAEEVGEGR